MERRVKHVGELAKEKIPAPGAKKEAENIHSHTATHTPPPAAVAAAASTITTTVTATTTTLQPIVNVTIPRFKLNSTTVGAVATTIILMMILMVGLGFRAGHSFIVGLLPRPPPAQTGPSDEDIKKMQLAVQKHLDNDLPLTRYGCKVTPGGGVTAGRGVSPGLAEGGGVDNEEEGDDCSICLDPFTHMEPTRTLRCGHFYHPDCIDPWLVENSPRCPLCKDNVLAYTCYGRPRPASPPPTPIEDERFDSFDEGNPLFGSAMHEMGEVDSLELGPSHLECVELVELESGSDSLYLTMGSPCENDSLADSSGECAPLPSVTPAKGRVRSTGGAEADGDGGAACDGRGGGTVGESNFPLVTRMPTGAAHQIVGATSPAVYE